jgi:hypothetical protein
MSAWVRLLSCCICFFKTGWACGSLFGAYRSYAAGASRVRKLFKRAREAAPAILFLDELDALGGSRQRTGRGNDTQTLNQLLTEMDGFATKCDPNGALELTESALSLCGVVPWSVLIPNLARRRQSTGGRADRAGSNQPAGGAGRGIAAARAIRSHRDRLQSGAGGPPAGARRARAAHRRAVALRHRPRVRLIHRVCPHPSRCSCNDTSLAHICWSYIVHSCALTAFQICS